MEPKINAVVQKLRNIGINYRRHALPDLGDGHVVLELRPIDYFAAMREAGISAGTLSTLQGEEADVPEGLTQEEEKALKNKWKQERLKRVETILDSGGSVDGAKVAAIFVVAGVVGPIRIAFDDKPEAELQENEVYYSAFVDLYGKEEVNRLEERIQKLSGIEMKKEELEGKHKAVAFQESQGNVLPAGGEVRELAVVVGEEASRGV